MATLEIRVSSREWKGCPANNYQCQTNFVGNNQCGPCWPRAR